jgi:hypothetical protein
LAALERKLLELANAHLQADGRRELQAGDGSGHEIGEIGTSGTTRKDEERVEDNAAAEG